MNKRRILVIAGEAWREDTNAGNVLVNLFSGMVDEFEFAEIYVGSQMPKNDICQKYFQFSEKELIRSLFTRDVFGHRLQWPIKQDIEMRDFTNSGRFYSFRQSFPNIIYPIREFLWSISKWKSDRLVSFVQEFDPDIIFAPIYYYPFMANIVSFVHNLNGKKIVSYTGDDYLTMKQFSLSPFFWINRMISRRVIITLSKQYSKLYTMTEEQKYEYEKILHIPISVFKKGGDFSNKPLPKVIKKPIKIVYGGGLIFGRYKTLARVRKAIADINKNYGHSLELYIYTQTAITGKYLRLLHDGENSFLIGKVGQEELNKAYSEASIALHVESFTLANRLDTRISFSTKIIDLMRSNCCIMAICWEKSSPYIYLKNQNAAICVGRLNDLKYEFAKIINDPKILQEYAERAWECGYKNHRIEELQQSFKNDFLELIDKRN